MTPLFSCILQCCSKNISDSNICALTAHPKAQQIVQQVTHKHFSDGRSDFHGSTVSGHNELMTCSMGTVFYALKKTRRDNITTGFPNTWLVKTPQQIEANFALWVHSRLLEDVGRGHNCGARTNSSTHTNGRMRIFSSLSYTNDSGDSNEHDVHVDSNPETILIERMELQQQTEMIDLIHHFPLIAMSTVLERIENQTEMSWALIPKINANNLCKWIMGSPRTSLELNFIEQLWPHTKFTPHQLLCWKRNLPFMTIELDTSNAAYSKITKEYTVLALAGIESILTLRNHSEAVKMRETLRKNINITESGVNWMCLIAGLRMHGTSADGVSFHRHMVQYFLDRSEYAIPKTIDVQSLISDFLQTNTQNGTEVRIGQLIQLIARLRYGKRLEQLTLNKKNNCRRIALIASHIGRRLQILYPHAAIRKSSL